MKQIPGIGLGIALGLMNTASAQLVTNFTSPKGVYDFAFTGYIIWAATSGGLFKYDSRTGEKYLRPADPSFPDPLIRALACDGSGNLWAGSDGGYLLMRNPQGGEYYNDAYVSAGWRIFDMIAAGKFLIIASDKGVGLFDTEKRKNLKIATRIGTFASSQIYTLAQHDGRLYAGGESGVAVLKTSIDSIANANFYDPSIWIVDSNTPGPVYSFLSVSGVLKAFDRPSARFKGAILTADSTFVVAKGTNIDTLRFGSAVTCIGVKEGDKCAIGTEEDFLWCWDGERMGQISISGPTFASANRVLVDRGGTLWVLPYGFGAANWDAVPVPWWLGVNSFDGHSWRNFGPAKYPEMGHMATSTRALAILQTRDGRLWFGFEGGQIKCHDPADGSWMHYCIFGQGEGNGAFIKTRGGCPESDWGKCDALAQDSAGYMWIASWNNYKGSLLCYKPSPDESDDLSGRYRRFPPMGEMNAPDPADINTISIDRFGNIIYGTENGVLYVATYDADPIEDSIKVIKETANLQKIFKAVSFTDGTTLIIAASGVHRYDPSDNSLTRIEDFDRNVTTLDCENDNILWYGIPNEGVVRYDMINREKTLFNRGRGLIFTQINDVHVDRRNGCVWVATDRGVSRLSLGYTAAAAPEKKMIAFPNPFSRKKHKVIYFREIPLDGTVSIHGLNGNLVATPKLLKKGEWGACYEWKPPSNISPGTYFYVVVTSSLRRSGKMILTP